MKAVSVVVAIALGYFLLAPAPCETPLPYKLGTIDPSFSITEAQAKVALSDAEAIWEEGVGEDMFVYDPEATLTVNFVYDDRQARTDEERTAREELSTKRNVSNGIQREYEGKVASYEERKAAYDTVQREYEKDLAAYNEEVEKWNERGGAPEDVYDELHQERARLQEIEQELNEEVGVLNELIEGLNELSVQGEALVNTYNAAVEAYNATFNAGREFTQGDYQNNQIHIYEYSSGEELRLVLAHELGHALSLDHVEGPQSIMYYFMGEQDLENGLTTEDVEGYQAQCSPKWYHRQYYY